MTCLARGHEPCQLKNAVAKELKDISRVATGQRENISPTYPYHPCISMYSIFTYIYHKNQPSM